jgi:hypothetical protein
VEGRKSNCKGQGFPKGIIRPVTDYSNFDTIDDDDDDDDDG